MCLKHCVEAVVLLGPRSQRRSQSEVDLRSTADVDVLECARRLDALRARDGNTLLAQCTAKHRDTLQQVASLSRDHWTHSAIRMPRDEVQLVGAFTRAYIDERFPSFEPMATQPRHLRAEDVPLIPVPDDISGYELVNGELVPVMPSRFRHAWLVFEVCRILDLHVRSAKAGVVVPDVWCKLPLPHDLERLHAPDVAYFTAEKVQSQVADGIFRVPPDLVVEIFSATNLRKPGDFQRRVRDYLDAGVGLLWVLYPDAGYAMVHRSDGSARMVRETEALEGEDVLPGFRLQLGELFQAIPGARPAT